MAIKEGKLHLSPDNLVGRTEEDEARDLQESERLKKEDFGKWYESQKILDWKDNYLKYNMLKSRIETMYQDLYNFFSQKAESKNQQIFFPKDDKRVKETLEKFDEKIMDDLQRVSAFYHQEEIKVLSLTYDLMTELKMITVQDFSRV